MKRSGKYVCVALLAIVAAGCGSDAGGGGGGGDGGGQDGGPGGANAGRPYLLLGDKVLSRLSERRVANDPAWVALAARCDKLVGGTVEKASGNAYPDLPDVGPGYQGDGYLEAVFDLGLCFRVAETALPDSAMKWGAAGAHLVDVMATPASDGGVKVETDSGYGIRNYGVGLAFGYDWLYPAFDGGQRARVITALSAWIDFYDKSGFIHDQPIGNYAEGYLLAKAAAAFTVRDDSPSAAAWETDVEDRLWGKLVQPAYTTGMKGGGWPEGWEYGPRSVVEVTEFLRCARTARGFDWDTQLPQIHDQAMYMEYFAWPSLQHMDDQGTVRSGVSLLPSLSQASTLAMLAEWSGDDFAKTARSFAVDLAANQTLAPWEALLFADGTLPTQPYTQQQLSYFAPGPGHVAMRSAWTKDAVWASLVAGPYLDSPDSGEQLFNQGSVAVVQGDQPILVNATGWLPQKGGSTAEDFVYQDSFGMKTRKLYNVFFVDDPTNPNNPGQDAVGPADAKTHVEKYEDGGGFVRARAVNLEDMYAQHPITTWSRDLVYVRPDAFVILDHTTVAGASQDQWLAFHVPVAPATSAGGIYGIPQLGQLQSLLPASTAGTVVALPGGAAWRIELHAPNMQPSQDWLTVLTLGASAPTVTRFSAADGNVTSGAMAGAQIGSTLVLLSADHAGAPVTGGVHYTTVSPPSTTLIFDLTPGPYTVTTLGNDVTVAPGGSMMTSANGTLKF
jgi:hypothetical protein